MTSDEWRVVARQFLADGIEVTELRLEFEDAIALAEFNAPRVWLASNSLWAARRIPDPRYMAYSATCIAIALSRRAQEKK